MTTAAYTSHVKIGYSSHPAHRMTEIRCGHNITLPDDLDRSQPVELIHTITDCRMRDERIVQALFARHHVIGEWFRFDLPFIHQLAGLRYVTDHQRALDRAAHKRRVKAMLALAGQTSRSASRRRSA